QSEARAAAGKVVEKSRARSRLKYEALGLATRARASRFRSPLAVKDARTATEIARRLADPAVLLQCLAVLLELEGNDELLAEARKAVQCILEELSQESLRRKFLANVASKVGGYDLGPARQSGISVGQKTNVKF